MSDKRSDNEDVAIEHLFTEMVENLARKRILFDSTNNRK